MAHTLVPARLSGSAMSVQFLEPSYGFIRADAAVGQLAIAAFGARVAASLSGARYSEIEYLIAMLALPLISFSLSLSLSPLSRFFLADGTMHLVRPR